MVLRCYGARIGTFLPLYQNKIIHRIVLWPTCVCLNTIIRNYIDLKYFVGTSCNIVVFLFSLLIYQSIGAFVGTFVQLIFGESFTYPMQLTWNINSWSIANNSRKTCTTLKIYHDICGKRKCDRKVHLSPLGSNMKLYGTIAFYSSHKQTHGHTVCSLRQTAHVPSTNAMIFLSCVVL